MRSAPLAGARRPPRRGARAPSSGSPPRPGPPRWPSRRCRDGGLLVGREVRRPPSADRRAPRPAAPAPPRRVAARAPSRRPTPAALGDRSVRAVARASSGTASRTGSVTVRRSSVTSTAPSRGGLAGRKRALPSSGSRRPPAAIRATTSVPLALDANACAPTVGSRRTPATSDSARSAEGLTIGRASVAVSTLEGVTTETSTDAGQPGELRPHGNGDQGLDRATLIIAGVVVLGAIMSILDITVVSVALQTFQTEFDATAAQVAWTMTAYTLALASVIPLTGWAADRFGTKRLYLLAVALFTAGSVLCATATSLEMLVGFRVAPGSRRRHADAARHDDPDSRRRPRPGRPRDGRAGHPDAARPDLRPHPRRLADRHRLLALDLPDQPAHRHRHAHLRRARAAEGPRRALGELRLARHGAALPGSGALPLRRVDDPRGKRHRRTPRCSSRPPSGCC